MLNIHYKCFWSGIFAEEKIFDILNPAAADRLGRVLILKGEYSQGVVSVFCPGQRRGTDLVKACCSGQNRCMAGAIILLLRTKGIHGFKLLSLLRIKCLHELKLLSLLRIKCLHGFKLLSLLRIKCLHKLKLLSLLRTKCLHKLKLPSLLRTKQYIQSP